MRFNNGVPLLHSSERYYINIRDYYAYGFIIIYDFHFKLGILIVNPPRCLNMNLQLHKKTSIAYRKFKYIRFQLY